MSEHKKKTIREREKIFYLKNDRRIAAKPKRIEPLVELVLDIPGKFLVWRLYGEMFSTVLSELVRGTNVKSQGNFPKNVPEQNLWKLQVEVNLNSLLEDTRENTIRAFLKVFQKYSRIFSV